MRPLWRKARAGAMAIGPGGRSSASPSNPKVVLGRALSAGVARIGDAARFDQQELHLALGEGLVLHSVWDDEHFAGADRHGPGPEVDSQLTVENEERLIGLRVRVPDEVSFETNDLELIVVHFRNHSGLPRLREAVEFFLEPDRPKEVGAIGLHGRLPCDGPAAKLYDSCSDPISASSDSLSRRAEAGSAKMSSAVTALPVSDKVAKASGTKRAAMVARISRKSACA